MEKVKFKLGSIQNMLTKEEMKKVSGGYLVCCCQGGTYGYLCPNGCWSGGPSPYSSCSQYCNSEGGASGSQWDSSSCCNHMC